MAPVIENNGKIENTTIVYNRKIWFLLFFLKFNCDYLPNDTENIYPMTVTTRTTFLSCFGSYKSSKSASDIDPDPEKAGSTCLEAQLTGYFTAFEFPWNPFMTFDILNYGVLCQKLK